VTHATQWGRKAEDLYATAYARKYREHDDQLRDVKAYRAFCDWLENVCGRFDRTIDALDLGCGTGRYFAALKNVKALVGIDASAAMLDEAARPVDASRITAGSVRLVHGDALTYEFAPASFDLVYSIGVLAEHTPFDDRVVANVCGWLRPGGRFAFTTVHPDSSSIPKTAGRVIGRALLPWTTRSIRRWLRSRLMAGGQYADEAWIEQCFGRQLTIESLDRLESEAHLHCVCVARKSGRDGQ
jgi:SAM-dependent methyltransferase